MKKMLFAVLLLPIFLSCEEVLMEDDISDETVTLVAPANNTVLTSTSITFTWNEIEYGTQYRIQVARPDFDNPLQIMVDTVVDTTSFTTQLNVGQYQWRVKGVNSAYETAYTTHSFTILSNEDFQNNSVSLVNPANNLVTNTLLQSLSWQAVLGATSYHFEIADASGSIIYNQDLAATSLNYTFDEGSFKWKVRATDGNQNTLFSERNILVDVTAPNTPSLSSPANLSTTAETDIDFVWTRTAMTGSNEKDSIYIYTNSNLSTLFSKSEQTSPYTYSALPDGTYYWYVKSFDAAGNIGNASNTFQFTKD